ncbi:Fic family protein [Lacticaseibacillus sharpeae]|uniref:Fido domain-containing protein n=2 Tax=Lacticaseibacillus sharpeae TaxID=1626 RepID=A0A0R1ZI78_9LACO|nr:Fic family protein [Lacticaseibacillus sharpeae]KRM54680.1 hypothetical protein FC18_GL002279 [Lacticaseibacillus sharpeae JCM 1186 = DSM 20505]
MANYKLLSKFKYGADGRTRLSNDAVENEYQKRLNGYSTVITNLYPRLVDKEKLELGLASGHSTSINPYPIFWVVTPQHLQKIDEVHRLSTSISAITSRNNMPQVAVESYLRSLLTNEIFFTNEIEGVHTNPEEISTIVWDVDSEKKSSNRRLESTIRQYTSALGAKQQQIKTLADFRNIYNQLLKDEISDKDLPDGTLFRDSFVFIGKGSGIDKTAVHLPPEKESEINVALTQLISFMNDDRLTPIDKSLATHFMFENTHPFKDGNGRTGRYLLSSYLSKKLDSFTGLTISTSIHNHVQKYYQLFRDAGNIENRGDLTNFIDGMLDIIIDGQQSVITQMQSRKSKLDENMKHIQKLYPTLNDDYNSILYIFLQSKLFTDGKKNGIQDRQLAEIAKNSRNISRRAFKTIIDDLTDKKIITLVSSNPLQHVLSDNCIN